MKSLKLTLILTILTTCLFAQTTYKTGNVNITNQGEWVRVATASIPSQYKSSQATIQFIGGASEANIASAKILFRVKQQDALPSSPFIQVELLESNSIDLSNDHFKAIITNTQYPITVDLYVKIDPNYASYAFTPTLENISSDANLTYHNTATSDFITTTNLTSLGTVINCIDKTAPQKLDIVNGNIGVIVGANSGGYTRTNNKEKYARIGAVDYASGAPFTMLMGGGVANDNYINIGGGTKQMSSATSIKFYTANNTSTILGTERMRINSIGNVGIGTSAPTCRFQVNDVTHFMRFYEIDGTANKRMYGFTGVGDRMTINARDDAGTFTKDLLTLYHDGLVKANQDFSVTGKLGVGTTNPTTKLEIKSSGTLGGKYNEESAFAKFSDGNITMLIDPNEIYSNSNLYLGVSGDYNISFRNIQESTETDLMIIKPNGNVGIGNSNPQFKLDVNSGNLRVKNSTAKIIVDMSNTAERSELLMFENGVSKAYVQYRGATNSSMSSSMRIGTSGLEDIRFANGGITRMIISKEGGIGIGTENTTGYALAVNGSIKTKAIKVTTYVEENKHLPNVPSEAEVEAEGLDLGEMNAKLLEKVEELTLYMIQMQEEVIKSKEETKALKKRLAALESN